MVKLSMKADLSPNPALNPTTHPPAARAGSFLALRSGGELALTLDFIMDAQTLTTLETAGKVVEKGFERSKVAHNQAEKRIREIEI